MNPQTGLPWQNYDRFIEVEIPAGEYVYLGYAAKQNDRYPGGGTQLWIEDSLVNDSEKLDWIQIEQQAELLPQF